MEDNNYIGALAQLARALRWQCRGHRFESDMLHFVTPQLINNQLVEVFFSQLLVNNVRKV